MHPPQSNQGFYINPEDIPREPPQEYGKAAEDLIETYGGIIKDLTDTEQILKEFELRLQGMIWNKEKRVSEEVEGLSKKMDKATSIEFVDMMRSIVNQNTHFSNFDTEIITNILNSANYSINRWLMFQGERVPLRYRPKIAFQAMNLIIASLYKSSNGTILDWTKGSFSVGEEGTPQNKQRTSDMFFPWNWNKGR